MKLRGTDGDRGLTDTQAFDDSTKQNSQTEHAAASESHNILCGAHYAMLGPNNVQTLYSW